MAGDYDLAVHHRRSIRLKGYDYAQAGAYFVTICTYDRKCFLGDVCDGEMQLNDAGRMVQSVWDELPARFPGLELDAFVMMPNHVHGIILVGALLAAPSRRSRASLVGAASSAPTLGDMLRGLSSREVGLPLLHESPQALSPVLGLEMSGRGGLL